jgi:hypothetical protein
LLATNNLFVDYLNDFLLNPELGEKLRFNYVTGDLELIENEGDVDNEGENEDTSCIKQQSKLIRATRATDDSRLSSTAEGVKRRLESQLKSIIKKNATTTTSTPNRAVATRDGTSLSEYFNRESSELVRRAQHRTPLKFQQDTDALFDQINKHSFKDIDLIKIEARIEPSDLKDPKATAEARIPVISTRYSVNTLKKPFSLKWLRNRRLTLFLQSEFYTEFKLAMILAQMGLFNHDLSRNNQKELQIKYFKVEIDNDIKSTSFNP